MTYYESELQKIRGTVYSNQLQLQTVIGIRNYINTNYHNDLNLDFLSHTLFVSKFHLLRLFKKYYGQTPKQYLTDKRLEKAKEYLKTGLSITETCFAIGFECPNSFSTLFKHRTGFSPTEFLKKQLSQGPYNLDNESLGY